MNRATSWIAATPLPTSSSLMNHRSSLKERGLVNPRLPRVVTGFSLALGEPPHAADPLLDSLCRADLLWCLVAYLHGGRRGTRDFYTSFAALYEHRVQPIVRRLLVDQNMISTIFPNTDREALEAALGEVLRLASTEGGRYGHVDFTLTDVTTNHP